MLLGGKSGDQQLCQCSCVSRMNINEDVCITHIKSMVNLHSQINVMFLFNLFFFQGADEAAIDCAGALNNKNLCFYKMLQLHIYQFIKDLHALMVYFICLCLFPEITVVVGCSEVVDAVTGFPIVIVDAII